MEKNTLELLLRTLSAEKERIDTAITELKAQLSKSPQAGTSGMGKAGAQASTGGVKPRRTMSAAARRKIS